MHHRKGPAGNEENGVNSSRPRRERKVRHLPDDANLYRMFLGDDASAAGDGSTPGDAAPAQDFADLLEEALAAENLEVIRAEKERGEAASESAGPHAAQEAEESPDAELDLHGCTAEEAVRRVRDFVLEAQDQSGKTVRLIVGKGFHSAQRAILPDVVEREAARLRRQGIVRTFRWEHRRKRKSGSLLVELLPAAGRRRK
jgi:DNA-nicking Smr family endonuclease